MRITKKMFSVKVMFTLKGPMIMASWSATSRVLSRCIVVAFMSCTVDLYTTGCGVHSMNDVVTNKKVWAHHTVNRYTRNSHPKCVNATTTTHLMIQYPPERHIDTRLAYLGVVQNTT